MSDKGKPMPGIIKGAAKKHATTKVIDESEMRRLVNEDIESGLRIEKRMNPRYLEWLNKVQTLIKLCGRYHPLCSMRFLKDPTHLDLKFEKSFTTAIQMSKTSVLGKFPRESIKTCYVFFNQASDPQDSLNMKRNHPERCITTPLHLACQMSNEEAARILLTDHNFDVNILLHDRNFLVDLLDTASWEDYSILMTVLKKRKVCVNSGR
jgi:hypothetical protein